MTTNIRHSIARTDQAPFDGHEGLNPDASFGDLLVTALHHFEGGNNFEKLANLMIQDDLELITELCAHDDPPKNAIRRVTFRDNWLSQIAPELERRMAEAEAEAEQHEEDDWELYRVPTANGVPQFEHARLALGKDFNAVGFVYRSNVVDAIGVLLRGKDETSRVPAVGDISEVLES